MVFWTAGIVLVQSHLFVHLRLIFAHFLPASDCPCSLVYTISLGGAFVFGIVVDRTGLNLFYGMSYAIAYNVCCIIFRSWLVVPGVCWSAAGIQSFAVRCLSPIHLVEGQLAF